MISRCWVIVAMLFYSAGVAAQGIDLGGLFGGAKVRMEVSLQAARPEVARYKKISVFDFSGKEGSSFTNSLRNQLSNAEVKGVSSFTIVASELLQPAKMSIPNIVAAGKKLGVEAIYYGAVENVSWDKQRSTEERTECTKSKGFLRGCEKGHSRERNVSCSTVTGYYQVTINVINVKSGNTIYTRQLPGSSSKKWCRGDEGAMPEGSALASEAKYVVVNAIAADLIPRTRTIQVAVKKASKLEKPDTRTFKDAIRAVKAERWDKACGRWGSLEEKYPENTNLIYNLGLCAEYLGDLGRAGELYQKADSLVINDKAINAALTRVEESQAAEES